MRSLVALAFLSASASAQVVIDSVPVVYLPGGATVEDCRRQWQTDAAVFAHTAPTFVSEAVRTIDAPSWIATVDAMGATPAPMAWAEVYSALQLGAIDGAEAQLTGAFGIKLHEVSTNVAFTNHIQLFTGLATSEAWWQSLPEDLRAIVSEELSAAGDEATQNTVAKLAEVQAEMEAAGVAFNEVDLAPFKEATAGVYDEVGLTEAREALAPYLP